MLVALRRLAFAALVLLSPAALAADAYPTKPVSMIVPFTAAGPTDALGRLLAKSLAQTLGQPVNVDNVAGQGGATGAAKAAKATADGHTLLLHHFALPASPALYPNLAYDPLKDFEPIGLISSNPYILVVRTSLPIKSAADALKYIRDNKEKVTFGHAGIGSGSHLTNLVLRASLGKIKFTEKTYRGTGPALTDLAAGQLDFLMDQSVNVAQPMKDGTVRALAVTTPKRNEAFKDLPTLQEAGLKGFDVTQWFALYAPKGTPKATIEKLSAALDKALSDPANVEQIKGLGATVFPAGKRGPADARKLAEAETQRWKKTLKDVGYDPKEAAK